MKTAFQKIIIIMLGSLIISCGGNDDQQSTKQNQLDNYKKELKELQSKIATLELELGIDHAAEAYPVSIMTLKKSDFKSHIEIPGTITSKQNVLVFAEMPGNITSVAIREGQYITKGTLIAQQDATALDNQVRQVQVNLDLAKTTFARQERLWQQKIGSEIQYLQAKTTVEALEAQVNSLRSQAGKYNIVSPINGTVDEVFVNQGETPQGPVARIINLNNIQMEAQLSEKYIGKVKRGDQVTVLIPNLGLELNTRVNSVGQVINPMSRTFRVEVSLRNASSRLKPNMTATMKIMLEQINDTITIPANVIMKDYDRDYVFIADSAGVAKKEYITISNIYQGLAAISSGLEEGDKLIVGGHTEIDEATPLIISNDPDLTEEN